MSNKRALYMLSATLLLCSCNQPEVIGDESANNISRPVIETPAITPELLPAPVQSKAAKPLMKRRSAKNTDSQAPAPTIVPETTANTDVQNTEPAAIPQTSWQPNQALIIRAKELLSGLEREIGRPATVSEKQKRLQSHMGLSAAQSHKLIVNFR